MEISLTISYHVTIDKDEFWDSETGELNSKIECQFEKIFPKKIKLSDKDTTKRNYISYYPLHEGKNCLRCAFCGKWLLIWQIMKLFRIFWEMFFWRHAQIIIFT